MPTLPPLAPRDQLAHRGNRLHAADALLSVQRSDVLCRPGRFEQPSPDAARSCCPASACYSAIAFLTFLPRWTAASRKSSQTGGCMSPELPARPTCPACGSMRVGTLAKQITKDTAWRCADCGETFKAKPSAASTTQSFVPADPRRNRE